MSQVDDLIEALAEASSLHGPLLASWGYHDEGDLREYAERHLRGLAATGEPHTEEEAREAAARYAAAEWAAWGQVQSGVLRPREIGFTETEEEDR